MDGEIITEDGEIIAKPSAATALATSSDTSGLMTIVRAEIDAQIVTAKQFPRSIQHVIGKITSLATLDEETAAESLYALVRGSKRKNKQGSDDQDSENKPIEGPSIRLAEIAAQCYGNCRIEARTIATNRAEKYVEAEGIFLDLETNMASKATVRRRISTRAGYLFSEDMILVTSNAACAIAKRNAILAGIPRGIYRPAYLAARRIVAGTAEALSVNRDKAIKAFAAYGVTPAQIFDALKVEGDREITTDHLITLRAMFATLKNGEDTVESMFSKPEAEHKVVKNPLDDKAPASEEEGKAAAADAAAAAGAADQAGKSKSAGDAKAADDSKPAAETAKAADKSAGEAQANAPVMTEEQKAAAIDEAYSRGEKAKAANMTVKALPSEYKAKDRSDEAAAWRKGYDGSPLREPGEEG